MSYLLTKDQLELQAMVREFVQKEVTPISKEYDEKGEMPREVFQKAVEMGLTSLTIPEKYGGAGLSHFTDVVITEEMAKGDAGFSITIGACKLAIHPVLLGKNEGQIQKVADILINGGLAAFCLTEAEAGSDAAAVRTTAVKDGDDYIINGSKTFITNGGIADIYTVFASTDRSKGSKGITAFLVERNRPGVSSGKDENKMGIRLSNTSDVIFDNVRIPAENVIGVEGEGYKIALKTLAKTRPCGCASAVGISQAALDHSIKYAKERKTFGQPIIEHQGIQFMLADMDIQTQAARQLVWHAARMLDEGIVDARLGAVVKTFASDTAMKVTTDAVQIFGGYGYSREYPVEKLMRNAKIYQIFEGTNQIQRIVIGNSLKRG